MVDAYPPQGRGKALGLAIAAAYIGLSVGAPLGGALHNQFGWRSIFVVTSVVGFISLIILLIKLPNDSKKSVNPITERFDALGNLMYIVAITLILYGISMWASNNWAISMVAVGLVIGAVFVMYALKQENPVLDVNLIASNKNYAFANISTLLNYAFVATVTYYLSIYLQLVKGLNPVISGAILMGQPLFQAIISPYAGKLSDKISPFKVATVGMAICAVGLFGFCIISSIMATHIGDTSLADAPPAMLVLSIRTGFILFTILCIIGIFFSVERKSVKLMS
jgi:predicted MFS family arabinose efflux permease